MRKTLLLFFVLSLIFSNVFAADTKFDISPVNPDLVKYLELQKTGHLKKLTDNGYPLGYVPHSLKYSINTVNISAKAGALPEVFDLRETGNLTPVKDQSTCGACWTFASYGSIESRWLSLGVGGFDMSEQNLKNGNGFEIDHCGGGNAVITTAYLVRGDGPISEEDDPYDVDNGDYVSGLTPLGYVPDARFLPNDPSTIKQIIYDYGAIYTDMYWDGDYYNSNNNTYFCDVSADSGTNHAVLLVGWNDTLQTAGGEGAWIIRNSWGTSFGDRGFFYISYNDSSVNSGPAFWPNRMDYEDNSIIHQYDEFGALAGIGCDNSRGYGLVKFTMDKAQQITKLGVWQNSPNSTVAFEIYSDFNGSSLSGMLASIGDQTCSYPGYYTFSLSSPLELNSGDDIYVKVIYNCPGEKYPVPIETAIDGYANPTIETGKFWVSCNGNSWTAFGGGTEYEYDLCIKAYGLTEATAVDDNGQINTPQSFRLNQNYPNPYNPSTTIKYSVAQKAVVNITVFNTLGQPVRELVNMEQAPGEYQVSFDAGELASGVYYYRLKSGKFTEIRKMIYLR
jgi:C1A family cysteine protease